MQHFDYDYINKVNEGRVQEHMERMKYVRQVQQKMPATERKGLKLPLINYQVVFYIEKQAPHPRLRRQPV